MSRSLVLGALSAFAICGCAGNGSTAATGPGVRVVNGLSSAPSAYVTAGTQVVASALPFATASGTPAHPYTILPLGPQTLSFLTSPTATQASATTTLNLTITDDVDAVAYNSASPTLLVLYDDTTIPLASSVRFVNASSVTGAVDIFLTAVGGALTGAQTLSPGQVSPSQTQPTTGTYTTVATAGTYQLRIFPAGNDSGTPLVNQQVQLDAGVTWTFLILDATAGSTSPTLLQVQDNRLHNIAP